MGKLEKQLVEAENTKLESIMAFYSSSKNSLIRLAVIDNPNATEELLIALSKDSNFDVSFHARSKLDKLHETQTIKQELSSLQDSNILPCFSCGESTHPGENFCRSCGNEIEIKNPFCLRCKLELEVDSKFCRFCGEKLVNRV